MKFWIFKNSLILNKFNFHLSLIKKAFNKFKNKFLKEINNQAPYIFKEYKCKRRYFLKNNDLLVYILLFFVFEILEFIVKLNKVF